MLRASPPSVVERREGVAGSFERVEPVLRQPDIVEFDVLTFVQSNVQLFHATGERRRAPAPVAEESHEGACFLIQVTFGVEI